MTAPVPQCAMVLAAGLGKRMRPLTDRLPKPLVEIGGRALIDWGLDALARAGVARAVVNVHHLPELLTDHLARRAYPAITISDESTRLLDSAGGIIRALPQIGGEPFYVLNADTFWIGGDRNLIDLALAWDARRMDILLMLADRANTTGHSGAADFILGPDGTLGRAGGTMQGHVYAGAAILHPRIFAGAAAVPHSLNLYFDRAIAANRLFGHVMEGRWITVGTADAITAAQAVVAGREGGA